MDHALAERVRFDPTSKFVIYLPELRLIPTQLTNVEMLADLSCSINRSAYFVKVALKDMM